MSDIWHSRGRCHVLGDDIPHDGGVIPFRFIPARVTDPKELLPHLFDEVDPTIRDRLQPGDFIVAGRNFLCGKAHNQGLIVFKHLGLKVLCESVPYRSLRAAIGLAVPLVSGCLGIRDHIRDGDEIDADLLTGEIRNLTTGAAAHYPAVSPQVREMVDEGGMKGVLTKYLHDHPALAQPPEPLAAE